MIWKLIPKGMRPTMSLFYPPFSALGELAMARDTKTSGKNWREKGVQSFY